MEGKDLKPFTGKKIRILTRDGFIYNGRIEQINGDAIYFRDKNAALVLLAASNIARVVQTGDEKP